MNGASSSVPGCPSRPLRRAIESRVEDPLSEELLRGEFQGKDTIEVNVVWDDNHERIVRLQFEGKITKEPDDMPVAATSVEKPTSIDIAEKNDDDEHQQHSPPGRRWGAAVVSVTSWSSPLLSSRYVRFISPVALDEILDYQLP